MRTRALGLCLSAAFSLFSAALAAQVIEVSGGASTLYDSQGAGVLIHTANTESFAGIGMQNGRFTSGGSMHRTLPHGSMTIGQQELRSDMPTDVFDGAHTFLGTGFGYDRTLNDGQRIVSFVGAASQENGTPLFRSFATHGAAAFLQWTQPEQKGCSTTTTLIAAHRWSAMESFQCPLNDWATVAFTMGATTDSPYLAASFTAKNLRSQLRASMIYTGGKFQRGNNPFNPMPEPDRENVAFQTAITHHLTFHIAHNNYTVPVLPLSSQQWLRTSVNETSLRYYHHGVGTYVTLLQSRVRDTNSPYTGSNALSAGFTKELRRFQWSEGLIYAEQTGIRSRTALFITSLTYRANAHLKLTERVNQTAGGISFSHGGALLTRWASFEADHQVYYVANQPGSPFQQAFVFDAQVRLWRSFNLHASSLMNELGAPMMTVQLGSTFAPGERDRYRERQLGIQTVQGIVVRTDGKPVDGAALLIGNTRVYTDPSGIFSFREAKPHILALHVLVDEFMETGCFTVLHAPGSVQTAADSPTVRIVVDRRDATTCTHNVVVKSPMGGRP